MRNEPAGAMSSSSHGDTRIIVQKSFIAVSLLIILVFSICFISLYKLSRDLNADEAHHNRMMIQKSLDNHAEKIKAHLQEYAAWGDAYENLFPGVNLAWAWDKQNLGKALYNNFSYEAVFVLSPDSHTQYSVLNGKLHLQPIESWLEEAPISEIFAALKLSQGQPIIRLVTDNGELTVLAAAWITPGNDRSIRKQPGPSSTMLFVDRLTPVELNNLGKEYGIRDLKYSRSSEGGIPKAELTFPVYNGSVTMSWQSENPGGKLLRTFLPILLLMLSVSFIGLLLVIRNTITKVRLKDENAILLEQSRQVLLLSETRFRDIAEIASDWIWEADNELRLIWISERFPVVTGCSPADWLGRPLTDFLHYDAETLMRWLNTSYLGSLLTLKHCRYLSGQQYWRYCNLTLKRVALVNGSYGFRGIATDVTLEVEAQEKVHFLSHHDELTGLPNRVQMKEFLEGQLHMAPTTGQSVVLMMLDLDNFKPVNDNFGHEIGDKLLHEISKRMKEYIGSSGLVTRHGGDEFIIIVTGAKCVDIDLFCRGIISKVNVVFNIDGLEINVGASIGVAQAPHDSKDPNDLIRFADIALYHAKNSGKNRWSYYSPDMSEQLVQRRETEKELRIAIHDKQLRLLYQPRYDTKSAKVYAVEALVRWQHPERGLLTPDYFIPLAEETGLITELSDWVLYAACSEVQKMLPGLTLSVNISAKDFENAGLTERIKKVLVDTDFPPSHLELEVTESAMLKSPDKAIHTMQQLKEIGVRFLIDDFGTGYASLDYLRLYPFDGIKLDKSFIDNITQSENAKLVIKNMIGLGKAYSLQVTAEGVETAQQVKALERYNCDVLQGYHIGRPVPLEDIRKMMSPEVDMK